MGICVLFLSVLSLLINPIVPHSTTAISIYRITFNLPDVPFSSGLRHEHSKEFKSVSDEVITAINSRLSEDYVSFRSASVHGFRYQAVIGTLVVIDLIFAKTSPTTAEQVQNTLVEHGSTYCWSHSVCPSGTACIEGQCCKSALASKIRKCPETEWECSAKCIPRSKRCDGKLDCVANMVSGEVDTEDDFSDEIFCTGGMFFIYALKLILDTIIGKT
ncbi:SEA domain-containing protein [Ditylenchus destructor]|uniref:SEA domain-containing protein n=1 Tax=Ditylenchus destructor TaxID=166010 RepID=A0AAD4NL39_9BILA|nr:SEA domain-containing protein [Ditylenchus destructor]